MNRMDFINEEQPLGQSLQEQIEELATLLPGEVVEEIKKRYPGSPELIKDGLALALETRTKISEVLNPTQNPSQN